MQQKIQEKSHKKYKNNKRMQMKVKKKAIKRSKTFSNNKQILTKHSLSKNILIIHYYLATKSLI